jgi:hypothetical protein
MEATSSNASGPPLQSGVPTTFLSDKYVVGQYQYPSDLLGNTQEYGGNYVIFYINVAEDSRILKVADEATVDPSDIPPRYQGDMAANNYNTAQTVAGAAGPGAVLGTAAGMASGISSAYKAAGAVRATAASAGIRNVSRLGVASAAGGAFLRDTGAGAALGAAPGVAGGLAVSALAGGKMGRQQKRLQKAIALYVPNQLNIRYTMDWQSDDTAGFQMAAAGATEMVKAVNPLASSNLLGTVGAIAASVALSKGPGGAAMSAATGLAANPKKENLFKSVSFRTFTFDYKFYPRNSTEAQNVFNVIKQFKLHMHPEYKDQNNFIFIYPSEFDIFYYKNGKENLNLHRHTSCVLTDMAVNYTPNQIFSTFENGMPTHIDVQLSFKEMAILTKAEIEVGF